MRKRFRSAGIRTCRSGKHDVPANVRDCMECRRIRDRRPERVKKRRSEKRKKNVIGGTCPRGEHVLTEGNTKRRTHDNALMCIPCLESLTRVRFKNDKGGRISGKGGDYSSSTK